MPRIKTKDTLDKVNQAISKIENDILPEHSLCKLAQAEAEEAQQPIFAEKYLQRYVFMQQIFFLFKPRQGVKSTNPLATLNQAEEDALKAIQAICHLQEISDDKGNKTYKPLPDKDIIQKLFSSDILTQLEEQDAQLKLCLRAITCSFFGETFAGTVRRILDNLFDEGALYFLIEHVVTNYSAQSCECEIIKHPRSGIGKVMRTIGLELITHQQHSQAMIQQWQQAILPTPVSQMVSTDIPITPSLLPNAGIATPAADALSVLGALKPPAHIVPNLTDDQVANRLLGTSP